MNPVLFSGRDRSRSRLISRRWFRTLVAVLFALAMLQLFGWTTPVVQVVVEMQSRAGADGEIFYARAGQEYQPDRRVEFAINPDGEWHTYHVKIPETRGLSRVRVDPGSTSGIVGIRRVAVEVSGPDRSVNLSGGRLSTAMELTNDLRAEVGDLADLRFMAQAPDPYVSFRLPAGTGVLSHGGQFVNWLVTAIAAALLWLLLAELAWPLFMRRVAPHLSLPRAFHRLAAYSSDPGTLIVAPRALALAIGVLCASVLYIVLNLHQSSIGVWEELFPAKPANQLVDLGTPKHIRSDEWNTQTPWVLNEVLRGKRTHNLSIGGEKAPLLAAVPVLDFSAIAQAQFYGFYLFDPATGFSWWWAYKTFGLALSFFWLFLLLTRGNIAAAALGTMWVYGSSFTQWWLSSNLPELLIAFALATIGSMYLLFARRRIMIGAGAALVAYSVLNLLLHLYPPFIVPLAYLGAAILAGLMLEPGRLAQIRERLGWRASCLIAAVLVVSLIGGNYLREAMPTMVAMADTIYPGHRVSGGGDFPLTRLLYGFFEVFRVGEKNVPLPPANASEASSFIILVPLLLLSLPFVAFVKRKNALLTALVLYCLVVGLWISVPLPRVVETAMQVIGWSWSPPLRSVLGLGMGSIVATTVLFSRVHDGTIELHPAAARGMVPILVLSCLLLFGWVLHGMDPVFFTPALVLMASAVVAVMTAGIVFGRTVLFAAGLVVAVAPALMVNPLVSGLSAIEDKPVLLAAKHQGGAVNDRWAVVGAFVFSQGLKAQGLEVITGSQMIPDRKLSHLLDPQEKYKNIWNRYAHVVLRSNPEKISPEYELGTPDLYVIELNVCGGAMRQLGVTNIAYTDPVPASDLKCLIPLDAPADSGVRLFRLSSQSAAATP